MPTEPELTLRPASLQDADPLATLYLTAREAAHPAIPRTVHTGPEVRLWFRGRFDAPEAEVWLAERDAAPVAKPVIAKPAISAPSSGARTRPSGVPGASK